MRVYDQWAAYCFDEVVVMFGKWVEGKLMETDTVTHKPLYTLEELLTDFDRGVGQPQSIEAIVDRMTGGGTIKNFVKVVTIPKKSD